MLNAATMSVVELARLRESSVKGHHVYIPNGVGCWSTVYQHSNDPYEYNALAKVATY